jgi:hypothetical protein
MNPFSALAMDTNDVLTMVLSNDDRNKPIHNLGFHMNHLTHPAVNNHNFHP